MHYILVLKLCGALPPPLVYISGYGPAIAQCKYLRLSCMLLFCYYEAITDSWVKKCIQVKITF